jgi:leucyl aminopeptidase
MGSSLSLKARQYQLGLTVTENDQREKKSTRLRHLARNLQEFVPAELDWIHFDVIGWNIRNRSAHPEGGEAMGVCAVFLWLKNRFENSS